MARTEELLRTPPGPPSVQRRRAKNGADARRAHRFPRTTILTLVGVFFQKLLPAAAAIPMLLLLLFHRRILFGFYFQNTFEREEFVLAIG